MELMKNGFHARRNAQGKRYEYYLDTREKPDVFTRRYSFHYPHELNIEAMEKAAEVLEKIDMDQLNRAIADLQKRYLPSPSCLADLRSKEQRKRIFCPKRHRHFSSILAEILGIFHKTHPCLPYAAFQTFLLISTFFPAEPAGKCRITSDFIEKNRSCSCRKAFAPASARISLPFSYLDFSFLSI